MIETRALSYTYPGQAAFSALDGISIQFPRDSISAVIGESGSGKTTLMMCLGRFLRPRKGQVLYDGTDIFEIPEPSFRQRLGMVFQKLYLFPHLSIRDNMTLAMRHALGQDKKDAEIESETMLERLGIADLLDRYPSQISGGQAQRAAIARGLLLHPDYMLLDEPTSALDARTTDAFAEWIHNLKDQTNFIIVTHDILFAERVADRGICLRGGTVVGEGPVTEAVEHLREETGRA